MGRIGVTLGVRTLAVGREFSKFIMTSQAWEPYGLHGAACMGVLINLEDEAVKRPDIWPTKAMLGPTCIVLWPTGGRVDDWCAGYGLV